MFVSQADQEQGEYINGILSRARKMKRPDHNEERELIRRAQAGDEQAMEHLLVAHSLFVQSVVMKFQRRGADLGDLWSVGMDGLRHAIMVYKLDEFNCKLVSMAVWWIRQRVTYEIYGSFNTIRVPINCVVVLWDMRRYITAKRAEGGCPTFDEFRRRSRNKKVSDSVAKDLWYMGQNIVSLNGPNMLLGADNAWDEEFGDNVTAPDDGEVENVHNSILVEHVMQAALTDQERMVLREVVMGGRTLDSVAQDLGRSRERIRQVKERALSKMRRRLETLEAQNNARLRGLSPIPAARRMPKKVAEYGVCGGTV